jgi:hypothetical protein
VLLRPGFQAIKVARQRGRLHDRLCAKRFLQVRYAGTKRKALRARFFELCRKLALLSVGCLQEPIVHPTNFILLGTQLEVVGLCQFKELAVGLARPLGFPHPQFERAFLDPVEGRQFLFDVSAAQGIAQRAPNDEITERIKAPVP